MESEPKPSFLDHAMTHLSLIDETDLSERMRMHLHLARMFVELHVGGNPCVCVPGAKPRIPRSGDARPGLAE